MGTSTHVLQGQKSPSVCLMKFISGMCCLGFFLPDWYQDRCKENYDRGVEA